MSDNETIATTTEATTPAEGQTPAAETPQQQAPEPKGWKDRRAEFLREQETPAQQKTEQPKQEGEQKQEPDKQTTEPKQDSFSRRFASLVAKERAQREQAESIKAERAQLDSAKAELAELKSLLGRDPIAGLAKLGYTVSDLNKRLLQGSAEPDPKELVKETEERLRKEFEDRETKSKAEREAQEAAIAQQRSFAQFSQEVLSELGSGAYPLCGLESQEAVVNEVLKEMLGEFNTSKKVLDFSEVLERLETRLQTHVQARNAALAQAAKGHHASSGDEKPASKADSNPKAQQAPRARTLANAHTTEGGPPKPLSWQERRRRFVES